MVEQAYVSSSLCNLDFRLKYRLTNYNDSLKPLIMFGMYNEYDYNVLRTHNSDIILVWQGMDALNINSHWIKLLKKKVIKHIAISKYISDSLLVNNIPHVRLPINATINNIKPHKKGDSIYFYSSDLSRESADYHGEYMLNEIRERTGLNVIRATYNTFNKKELINVYKKCFINLRLTKYDGCPNTNLEMGLMGRKSVYNGDLPCSLRWSNVDDVINHIEREYDNRNNGEEELINKQILTIINIDESWMQI